jgi:hypothetical protein
LTVEAYGGHLRPRESPDYKPYMICQGLVRVAKAIVVRKSAGVIPRVGSNPTRPICSSPSFRGRALLFLKVMLQN